MFGFDFASIARGLGEGLVGPLFSWLNKKEDVNLEKFKVNGQIDIAALTAHTEALKVRREALLEAMKYRGIRFFQYAFMAPLAIWFNASLAYAVLHPYWDVIKRPLDLGNIGENVLMAVIGLLFLATKIDEYRRNTK